MKKVIVNYAAILSGLAIAAFGVVAFVLPQGIMIGGTTGIGRILYYFYGIPVSYTVGGQYYPVFDRCIYSGEKICSFGCRQHIRISCLYQSL